MAERIRTPRHFQWERMHHAARIALPEDLALGCRDRGLPDIARTSLRLQ